MIKALLYPGAIVNGLATNMTFPKWDDVLDLYNLTNVKEASAVPDLQRLEDCLCDPTMVIAMICAFSMINYSLKKAMRAAPARPIAKPLTSSSKSKLK
ncbi:hypothetical protein YC2023_026721 [Brassica napus]